jgi:hypothetical protein
MHFIGIYAFFALIAQTSVIVIFCDSGWFIIRILCSTTMLNHHANH